MGNKQTRKASIYVKKLLSIIDHYLLDVDSNCIVSNAVVETPPSMLEYVQTVNKVTGWKKFIPSVPYAFVLFASFWVAGLFKLFGKIIGINPVRVKKLRRINNIVSNQLKTTKYQYKFTLETAFADWYQDNPKDWSEG